jgi:hypothetical protein
MAIMFSSYRYAMDDPCNEEVHSQLGTVFSFRRRAAAEDTSQLGAKRVSWHHSGARSALERASTSTCVALPWPHHELSVFRRMAQILQASSVHASLSTYAG